MTIIRNPLYPQGLIELTDSVNKITPQYGALLNTITWDTVNTSQDAIIFEINEDYSTLIPTISRRSRETIKPAPNSSNYITLRIPYWHHSDYITRDDIATVAQTYNAGTEGAEETFNAVRLRKLTKLRLDLEQSLEHMIVNAVKGITVDADGNVIADMFAETGKAQVTVNWTLSDPNFNVIQAIQVLKRDISLRNRLGSVVTKFRILCSQDFFDALVTHPQLFKAYENAMVGRGILAPYNQDRLEISKYGVTDIFDYGNVQFFTYPFMFRNSDQTLVSGVETGAAYTILDGIPNLYHAVYGSSNKLSMVGQQGRSMFAWEWRDEKDYGYEIELESAPLFYMADPTLSVKITHN